MRVTGVLWERVAVGRAVRRTFRRKSSGSVLLSDAPPLPREEQTPQAGGHAGTPGRADRRDPDTRPAGAGDGPPRAAQPHAPNPSQPKDQRPRGRPPRPGAASSPRRARPQGAPCQAAPMLAFEANQAPGPGLQPRPPRATDRKTRGRPASDPGTAARAESEPTERPAALLPATATRRSLQPPPRPPAERPRSGGPHAFGSGGLA